MKVFIAGAGMMGCGIAIDVARKYEVILYDVSREPLQRARKMISEFEGIEERISFTEHIDDAENCEMVIESVYEDLDVKSDVLLKIEEISDAILCSNTSVICIDDIAERLKSRGRFLGVHWMNPPYVMPLVEIILSEYTDAETLERVKTFLGDLRKEVVVCRNQSLVNRFNAAVLSEASKMIEEGVRFEDIDKVWKSHLGILYTLFGPLGNIDYIGIDVVHAASLYLYQRFGDEKFRPSEWLVRKIEKGELGIKTGKGVYKYGDFEKSYLHRVEKIRMLLKFLDQK
ncbi:3-hydroxyacyl-CoA dehydrogenase NAD-binding domain-containing protein [Geoglobus acetivorans]|uniref:3-hydroxyacyl-CoA dehydrogenase family protein n=1 Tax=Geoglobus acetivorans TaxID=565033 RepID=A0ABZ3H3E0_GEOAI|nr:3-hydroxyacyl-CoA dehydrogenase family protein [Geoglobus acetivorans]